MPTDHERFMRLALEEAEKGKAEGNIAVGSVIVQGDTVVARGCNLVTTTFRPHGARGDRGTACSWSGTAARGCLRGDPVHHV